MSNYKQSHSTDLFGNVTLYTQSCLVKEKKKSKPIPSSIQQEINRIRSQDDWLYDMYIRDKTDLNPDLMRIYGSEYDVSRGLAVPLGEALGNGANNVDQKKRDRDYSKIPFAFFIQNNFKFDETHKKKTRSENYAIRKRLQHYQIQPDRCQTCGTDTIDGDTTVFIDSETEACRVDNIETCSSVWSCPVCRHKILNKRQTDLNTIVEGYKADNGYCTLLTLTIPHKKAHYLHESKDGLLNVFKRFIQSKTWREFKEEIGLDGYARALETTYSVKNGFHPHIHILLFHSEKIPYRSAKSYLFEQWEFLNSKYLQRSISYQHGIDIRESEKSDYLAKWGGANELTSQTVKQGKENSYSISDLEKLVLYPERLVDHKFHADKLKSLERVLAVLHEYYTETKGNRLLTYSQSRYKDAKSLKDYYLRDEKTDEEITTIDDDDRKKLIPVMSITKTGWNEIYQNEHCTELKEIAEMVQFDTDKKHHKNGVHGVKNLIYECFILRYPQYKKHITPIKNYSEFKPDKDKVKSSLLLLGKDQPDSVILQDLKSCRYNHKLPKNHPNHIPF